jgi:hypothetical protein
MWEAHANEVRAVALREHQPAINLADSVKALLAT